MLNYCPQCGKEGLEFHDDKLWLCRSCDFKMYFNVAAATAGILSYKGKLVALRRSRDPGRGMLDLPGGFADPGERAEDAMLREIQEELGVQQVDLRYMTSFPNRYLYGGLNYATCDLFFTGELQEEPRLNDPEENSQLVLLTADQIQLEDFAFPSIRRGLDFFLNH